MKVRKVYTTAFMVDKERPGKILLGMKKRGFGTGKFTGFGGKVEKGEEIIQAAIRYCINLIYDIQKKNSKWLNIFKGN